jgi:hypothetical protein
MDANPPASRGMRGCRKEPSSISYPAFRDTFFVKELRKQSSGPATLCYSTLARDEETRTADVGVGAKLYASERYSIKALSNFASVDAKNEAIGMQC